MSDSKLKPTSKRKIERKIFLMLLALFFVMVFPYIRQSDNLFSTFYNLAITDLFSRFEANFFTTFPLAYLLSMFLIVILLFILVKTLNKQETEDEESLFNTYKALEFLSFFVYLMALYILINGLFFSFANVDGSSMEPTFDDNDYVIMQRMYRSKSRYDFVVVKPDEFEDHYLIKRIIGLPGEVIRIDNGEVYVDDQRLEETYLLEGVVTECYNNEDTCSFELDESSYFLLGDNRENSSDSRHFGLVNESAIYGVVNYRIWPLNAFGRIE